MVLLLLLLAAVLMEGAGGRPALPPLPVKGDLFWASTGPCQGEFQQPRCFPPDRRLLRGVLGGGTLPSGGGGGDPLLPHVQPSAAGAQDRPQLGKGHHLQEQRERVCGPRGQGARPAEQQAAVVPSGEGVGLGGIHLYLQVRSTTPGLAAAMICFKSDVFSHVGAETRPTV